MSSETKETKQASRKEASVPLKNVMYVGDKKISVLTMREPLVSDLLDAADMAGNGAGNVKLEAYTIAVVSDVPIDDLIKMKSCDYYAVAEKFRALEYGLDVGESASSS